MANLSGVEVRSSFPILYVEDVPEAVRFYRDLVGFEEIYRFIPHERVHVRHLEA